jgi:hypothetical protein
MNITIIILDSPFTVLAMFEATLSWSKCWGRFRFLLLWASSRQRAGEFDVLTATQKSTSPSIAHLSTISAVILSTNLRWLDDVLRNTRMPVAAVIWLMAMAGAVWWTCEFNLTHFLSKGWWPCLKGGGCSIGRTQLMMDRREGGRTQVILALIIKMRRGWMARVEVLWCPIAHRWQLSLVICDQTYGQQWQCEHGLW